MSSAKWKPILPPFSKFKTQVFENAGNVSGFIYQVGEDSVLRKPSIEISLEEIRSSLFKKKLDYLKSCLLQYRKLTGQGRAIAAVQVGISERFAVVYTPEKLITIINPKITKKSKKFLKYPEICMSANPVIVPLARPAWIEFEYYDEFGNLQNWKTKDDTEQGRVLNRVFQHEIDHMEGIINIDLVESSKELLLHSDPNFYKTAKFEKI